MAVDTILTDLPPEDGLPDDAVLQVDSASTFDSIARIRVRLKESPVSTTGNPITAAKDLPVDDIMATRNVFRSMFDKLDILALKAQDEEMSISTFIDAFQAEVVIGVVALARTHGPNKAYRAMEAAAYSLLREPDEAARIAGKWLAEMLNAAKYRGKMWGWSNFVTKTLRGSPAVKYHRQFLRMSLCRDMKSLASALRSMASAAKITSRTAEAMTSTAELRAVTAMAKELGVEITSPKTGKISALIEWAKSTPPVRWVTKIGGKVQASRKLMSFAGRAVAVVDFNYKLRDGTLRACALDEVVKQRAALNDFLAAPSEKNAVDMLHEVQNSIDRIKDRIEQWAVDVNGSIILDYVDTIRHGASKTRERLKSGRAGMQELTISIFATLRASEALLIALTDAEVREVEDVLVKLGQVSAGSSAALAVLTSLPGVAAGLSIGAAADLSYQKVWITYEQQIALWAGRALLEVPGAGVEEAILDYDRFVTRLGDEGVPADEAGLYALYDTLDRSLRSSAPTVPRWYLDSPGRVLPYGKQIN